MHRRPVFRGTFVSLAAIVLLAACGSSSNQPLADSGTPDSGQPDSGMPDSGQPDSGMPDSGQPDSGMADGGGSYDVTILHTNDLHSYMEGQGATLDYSPLVTGNDATVGGFARLSSAIQTERAAAGTTPVLLLDSGDFMMGTLFETIGTSQAAELTEMKNMGYDAITFGNHEFDFTSVGLAGILQAATSNGFDVPIVASNIRFSSTDSGDDALAAFQTAGVIVPKMVKTLSNGLKVGFFGWMGKNADQVAPLAKPVTFVHDYPTAQAVVDDLRNNDHVDLVVMLSHSGSYTNGTGEDVDLANNVNGIDVIISGHTHVAIPTPIVANHTIIVQSGAYGSNLGELKLTVTPGQSPRVTQDAYQLIPLDDSVMGDSATQTRVNGYIGDIDALFQPAGLSYAQVVAETGFDLVDQDFVETNIGDLVADAYLNTVKAVQSSSPPDVAVEVGGNIRTSISMGTTGQITFADLFKVVPLGIGPDHQPGYPLVTFYLNGADIKSGLELSASAQALNEDSYFLQIAGLSYTYNASGALFNRVSSATIGGNAVDFSNTSTCYKIVSTEYVAELLTLVQSSSGGLLSVTPKESDCSTVVTNFDSRIVDADPGTTGTQELHQWGALYSYMSSFPDPDANGVPNVKSIYATTQGRITAQ